MTTDHKYLVSNAHWDSQHSAEDPDDEDHHLGPGFGDVRLQGEHDGLIPEVVELLTIFAFIPLQPPPY